MKRVALVTGAGRGIGRSIALKFRSCGYYVIGMDLKFDAGTELDEKVEFNLAEVTNLAGFVSGLPRVDILVNNAAVLVGRPISEISIEDFDLMTAVNQRAPFFLSKACVEKMKSNGWGRIVNISSVAARTGGVSDSCVYAATKAAVLAMTKSFARNFGPCGITTNAIAPGAIETAMAREVYDRQPDMEQKVLLAVPLGRFGKPRNIADAVSFLCSDEAEFINGVTLDVNGGWVMV